jgi:peptidoglycan/xylan/chitin deacetylase (PgdA/CDA1 family)
MKVNQKQLTVLMTTILCMFLSFVLLMLNNQLFKSQKKPNFNISSQLIDTAHQVIEIDLKDDLKINQKLKNSSTDLESKIEVKTIEPAAEPKDTSLNTDLIFTREKVIKLPIIMYHHIDTLEKVNLKDAIAVGLRVSPEVFERQLKYIQSEGYTTITSYELADYIDSKKQLPKKPILLTFDDGYKDNYTNALPLLEKYNMKGDFGIITAGTDKVDYMSTQDIQDLVKKGHSLSSHTVNHCTTAIKVSNTSFQDSPVDDHQVACSGFAIQEKLSTGQIRYEFQKSKEELESKYGVKIKHLIYPFGFWNQQAVTIAKEVGYTFATTVSPEINETIDLERAFTMPRYRSNGQQDGELKGFFAGGR